MIIGYSRALPAVTDSNFASVKLLMGFEGVNGATGAPGMNDESSAAHGTATNGFGASVISVAHRKFGNSSLLLQGANINFADSADWNLGSGNFTVEAFVRPDAVSGVQFIIGQWNTAGNFGWELYLNGTALVWNVSTTGSNNLTEITGSVALSAATWYHCCIDYNGSKYRLYVDGVMVGSSSTPRTIFNSPNILAIGTNAAGGFAFLGYIDELRITKGVARYASDGGFTVPTRAFPRS